ncbi:sulfatase [Pontiella sulfatireligans]|uniref:Choline-sulfatase n=1 Tax=Pontiella sulfatireligans TaxID=2750658 RepID=A0A6C2UQG8_9BACT|nr:sulfatase [Pontiella sulfatireligans]SPS74514.1 sulfatase S1_7 [Kiritimatiellales bacterium]VGO22458.1 Choline-sulfatase [Pontiella sulfatireligans]
MTLRLLFSLTLFGAAVCWGDQPNVLFICIDDMRPQLGAYGHDYMITPNLDQLASEGRLFNHHYAQVPTCGPSRACMLTGKNLKKKSEISHPHLAQTLAGTAEPGSPETFIHHFKKNGYYTVGMGKISHSGSGWHIDKKTKKGAHELPHSWNEYLPDTGSRWGKQDQVHDYAYGKDRKADSMPPYECLELEDEDYPDGRLAQRAVNKLGELAESDQPVFMAVGFFKPHLPFAAPKKYWDLYDRAKIPLSPNPDLPDAVDSVFLHGSNEFFAQYPGGREKGGAGKRLSDDYAREIRHANFAAVTYMDAQVGKVLDQLKATGLDKNTIVVVWGDHGWHLGDHTIWGKHSTFERALNSLLLVKVPNIGKPGVAADGLVATIDIYPTLCELAGLQKPEGLAGESFVDVVNDPSNPGKPQVISYWRDILSMRTDRYRLALFNDGKEQRVMLFDHEADPNETRNVAEEYLEVVERLTALMKTNNRGFLPGLE